MILILVVLIFLVSGSILWLCLVNTREKFIKYKPVKENNKIAYKAMKPFESVIIKIKNFFGERFLRRLPISRASSKESEIAQAGKNIKKAGK